jgi:HSP20 family protein
MFGFTRSNALDDASTFHRQVERLFNEFWRDLPTRPVSDRTPSFQVHATDDAWRIDVPLPGIDPQHIRLEAAGNALSLRAEEPGQNGSPVYVQQTIALPPFLDPDRITASHRHGMLRLTVPLKDSVKPRPVTIDRADEPPRITAPA